ncbi:MAG: hypothetical protein ABIA04_07090 [Pseudomonadota bacterium]
MTKKILLIEDDEDYINILTNRIKSYGFTIFATQSGDEAITSIEKYNPEFCAFGSINADFEWFGNT